MGNDVDLEVSKEFECSKEDLFKAWTEQEQLQQWWKPLGKKLVSVTNDLTEGGEVKYQFEDNGLTIDGQYKKVSGHDELEYSWNWRLATELVENTTYNLIVRFSGEADQATIAITQSGFDNKESIQPHKQGWEQGLQQLAEYLKNKGGTQQTTEPSAQKPPISGYMETPEQQKVGGG